YLKSDREVTNNEVGSLVGQGEKNPPSYWALAGKVLLALAIVLILLFGFVKWLGRGGRKTGGAASFQVVASLWLSQQKSIKLVRVGSHLFLIGVGENLNLLYHFEKEEEVSTLLEELTPPSVWNREGGIHFNPFIKWLKKDVRRREEGKDDFKEELLRQLERLRTREDRGERGGEGRGKNEE
ncbi:MAG: flagellar biosynthetic protein FliO, partial [Thermicanus sp.]|nr:flagellar biosynthetic protein FliO [Thermicanus sp.]